MSTSDTERYFPSKAAMHAYWAMLRRDMNWWNWIAVFLITIVVSAAMLTWIAVSGHWFSFTLVLITFFGAYGQALHNIQQRQERNARLNDETSEAEDP